MMMTMMIRMGIYMLLMKGSCKRDSGSKEILVRYCKGFSLDCINDPEFVLKDHFIMLSSFFFFLCLVRGNLNYYHHVVS